MVYDYSSNNGSNFFVRVIESKDETLPVGTKVLGALGCKSHTVMPGKNLTKVDYLEDLPLSVGVGAAGMPGYVSLLFFLYCTSVTEKRTK